MRRTCLPVVAAALALAAPSLAHAACGVSTGPLRGKAPLTVTFTAACASSTYTWDFGDGQTAAGQTVQHVYRAGVFRPKLTSDAGVEAGGLAVAVSLKLAGPARARYGQWIVLHATIVPRLPVMLHGRQFIAGKLRVRVLGAHPWTATADGVASNSVRVVAVPRLVVHLAGAPFVGARLRLTATLHPASAGRVVAPASIDTRTARTLSLTATTRPAPGWARVSATVRTTVVSPQLALGAQGPSVLQLERRLAELRYAVQVDGTFGDDDVEAVYAFQKLHDLPRTGAVDAAFWALLAQATTPSARYPGDHIEVDKTRQVLFVVRGGQVALIVAVSTGATGNTPLGLWHVYRKVTGFDWVLYYPNYFLRGFAVHGYPDVPPYPASHGCVRIPMWIAPRIYEEIALDSAIYVYL